jgi:hypothetical protein
MNARIFCRRLLIGSVAIAAVVIMINLYIDIYGLFRDVKGRSISIYGDERTSKHLLAHRYVPANFDAYILGPSLSANLNSKKFPGLKIYNLSMMGANITEQKIVALKALERSSPSFIIVCLHPYLTMDHGMKSGMINDKEYIGALGSISLFKAYFLKIVRDRDLLPKKYPKDQFNDYGWNDYSTILAKMPAAERIRQEVANPNAVSGAIDSVAFKEFNEMIDAFRARNTRVIAYFHPLPYAVYDRFRDRLDPYQQTMTEDLKDKAFLIDFNDPSYRFFTEDVTNYIDHGHLSDKGQEYILQQILDKAGITVKPSATATP